MTILQFNMKTKRFILSDASYEKISDATKEAFKRLGKKMRKQSLSGKESVFTKIKKLNK